MRVTPQTVFKTAGFNHSPIPPFSILPDFIVLLTLSLSSSARFRDHCHWFVTSAYALYGLLFHLVARMGVAHGNNDSCVPHQFLHGHDVGSSLQEP